MEDGAAACPVVVAAAVVPEGAAGAVAGAGACVLGGPIVGTGDPTTLPVGLVGVREPGAGCDMFAKIDGLSVITSFGFSI